MVSPVNSSATQPVTPQPTFTGGAETRARTENVQPREAPAASSQRADRSPVEARESNQRRQTEAREERRSSESRNDNAGSGRRGSLVDIEA